MTEINYQKVLVATDGSKAASVAADHAIAIARAFQATLTVVAVVDSYVFMMDPQVAGSAMEILEGERVFLRQAVEEIATRAREANVPHVEAKVIEGFPRTTLVDLISESHADLVVIGSHGRNAIQRLLIGSTSEHLIRRAPCPVLVIRSKAS